VRFSRTQNSTDDCGNNNDQKNWTSNYEPFRAPFLGGLIRIVVVTCNSSCNRCQQKPAGAEVSLGSEH
jgi:hypothetical protein